MRRDAAPRPRLQPARRRPQLLPLRAQAAHGLHHARADAGGRDRRPRVRFHAGGVDASELPSSYKNADSVVAQIKAYDLAEIEDYIDPYGCIMAGDVPPVWLERKKGRR